VIMEITPTLRASRFSQLKPGELFIFANKSASAVGLATADPTRDGDMVMIPLGPGLPREMVARILDSQQMDVLSFGTTTKFGCQPMLEVGQSSAAGGQALLRPFCTGLFGPEAVLTSQFQPRR
jgi:hypothetical protein